MKKNGKRLVLSVLSICICGLLIVGICFYVKNYVLVEENRDAVGGSEYIEMDVGDEPDGIFTETQVGQESAGQTGGMGVDTVGGSSYLIPDDSSDDEKPPLVETPLD